MLEFYIATKNNYSSNQIFSPSLNRGSKGVIRDDCAFS